MYLPKRVDSRWHGALKHADDGEDVEQQEGDGEAHGGEEDDESRADAQHFDDAELVAAFHVPEELDYGEDPPWVAGLVLVLGLDDVQGWLAPYRKRASRGRVLANILLVLLKYAKLA